MLICMRKLHNESLKLSIRHPQGGGGMHREGSLEGEALRSRAWGERPPTCEKELHGARPETSVLMNI